jgi:YHS domain-containing protein
VARTFRPDFMIRTLLEEFVIPLILFLVVRSLLRGWFGGGRKQPVARRPVEQTPNATELKKDPVCGTYVSAASGFTRTVNGQLVYFCSKDCRDRFAG